MNDNKQNTNASPVLLAAIAAISTGQLYDLARGLMLSSLDDKVFLDLVLADLDQRAKEAREALNSMPERPSWAQE